MTSHFRQHSLPRLSRTYSWQASEPKHKAKPLVNLNLFLYSHAEATIPPMELEAELTAVGSQQSLDLCARLAGTKLEAVYVCPTTQCRQSVFPHCRARNTKYWVEWSLMDRISSQSQISHLQNHLLEKSSGGGVFVPDHLSHVLEREHPRYKSVLTQQELTHSSVESTQRVSERLATFVEALYDLHTEKMMNDQQHKQHRPAIYTKDADDGTDDEEEELNIDDLVASANELISNQSRMYSKNILICASPHTIDRLLTLLHQRPQPHHHQPTWNSRRHGAVVATTPMDSLQLFSGV